MKNKRGIFPKSATSILKAWLFQNLAVRFSIVSHSSLVDLKVKTPTTHYFTSVAHFKVANETTGLGQKWYNFCTLYNFTKY